MTVISPRISSGYHFGILNLTYLLSTCRYSQQHLLMISCLLLALVEIFVLGGEIVNKVFRVERFSKLILQQSIKTGISSSMSVDFFREPRLDLLEFSSLDLRIELFDVLLAIVRELSGRCRT